MLYNYYITGNEENVTIILITVEEVRKDPVDR